MFVQADVSTAEGVANVTREVLERLGGVDIMVNSIGGSSAPGGGFAALDDDEWQTALDTNLLPAVRFDRAVLPGMIERGSGGSSISRPYSAACRVAELVALLVPDRAATITGTEVVVDGGTRPTI
jgi:NAD(P)-dependent dehydrogenase (short-subunit alcohol dehydrogenase family)